MALDAMEGLIEIMLEKEGRVPESDAEEAIPRYVRLASTLQDESRAKPFFELLSARISEKVSAACRVSSRGRWLPPWNGRALPSHASLAATIKCSTSNRGAM